MYKGNIIILGAPGSGKGTLGKQLAKKYGYTVISTGDILRDEKKSGSDIGKKINDILGKGNLVPDDLVNEIIERTLLSTRGHYILDGYPRTIAQGEFLSKISDIDLVIYLEASNKTIESRILERGKSSGREDDQSVDIIHRRINQFEEETSPLIDYFKYSKRFNPTNKKILTYLDGEQSIEEVLDQAENILRIWS